MIDWLQRKLGGLGWRLLKWLPVKWRWMFRDFLALRRYRQPELRYLAQLGPNRGTALDIGANLGFYTHRLARLYDRVEAFEPNPKMLAELGTCPAKNVTIHPCGLSDHPGEATLVIPILHGATSAGYGTIEGTGFEADVPVESHRIPIRALDEFALSGVTFIKMDVEGHEMAVLRGGRGTITATRPIVLVEVKEENGAAIAAWFAELGYERVIPGGSAGAAATGEDWLFCPKSGG